MTEKVDYLESDQIIPEQQFACLSLVLPESTVQKRELYYMKEFFKRVCEKYELPKEKLGEITEDFEQFRQLNGQEMDRKFASENKNRTSVNGLKIRGVYETMDEAKHRADLLRARDPDYNVFIAHVGKWLPISPSVEYHIQNEQFLDTQLNDLIGGYKQNLKQKDEFYERQKREKMAGSMNPLPGTKQAPPNNIQFGAFDDTVLNSLSADHAANRASFNEQANQATGPIASGSTGASSSAAPSAGTAPARAV